MERVETRQIWCPVLTHGCREESKRYESHHLDRASLEPTSFFDDRPWNPTAHPHPRVRFGLHAGHFRIVALHVRVQRTASLLRGRTRRESRQRRLVSELELLADR